MSRFKDRDLGWLLLLLALSKRRPSSAPRWRVPEGPQPEENSIPQLPNIPDPPPDLRQPTR